MKTADKTKQGLNIEELRDSLEKKEKQILNITQISEQMNSGIYLDEALKNIYSTFRGLLEFKRIGLALLEGDNNTVILRWCLSNSKNQKLFEGHATELFKSSLLNVYNTNEPLIIPDLEIYYQEHPESDTSKLMLEEGMRSHLSCPLLSSGKIIGFLFFSSDEVDAFNADHINQFLHIARELTTIVDKTRMAELNEKRNQFLGTVVHDLKNPLAIIKGYTDMMANGASGELTDQQISMLITVQKNCGRMQKLIDDLLDVSAIESGKVEMICKETNVNDFLQNCHQTNSFLAREKSIILNLIIKEELPSCRIDSARMNQVMDNLIGNAIKYSHPNTTIEIVAEQLFNKLLIFVKDQGQGIPDTEIPYIFEHFRQTSVQTTGGEKSTGLGLGIVKQIVEAHQGTISVESEVNKGTTFTITIPYENKMSD